MPANAFVLLRLAFKKEGRVWTGECLELGTATWGRSLTQVQRELMELVLLHLNSLEKTGERERFFKEHGIKLYHDGDKTPTEAPVPVGSDVLTQVTPVRLPTPSAA